MSEIRLNGYTCCNLHEIFSSITQKYKVAFDYNQSLLLKKECNRHLTNMPFLLFLEQECKKAKLNLYISPEDSVIHISSKVYTIEEATNKPVKRYKGSSTKSNITITGKIIDTKSYETLPFVSIYVKGTTIGTTSNQEGLFTLIGVPTDTSTIVCRYIGYSMKEIQLTPESDLNKIEIQMLQDNINLQEVVVSTEKKDILQVNSTQPSMIKMSPVKLSSIPNLGEKDILRSFQLMPGISAANESSSGLYVRGGTPDQVLVQYDGFTVYNVEHLFGFFSAFNSNAIKDVQLYKGNFNAKYGGRLSSVVEITGKEGNQREFNCGFDASLMSLNAFVEFPFKKKFSFITTVRRSWKSPLYNKIFEQFSEENDSPFARPGGGLGGPGGMQTTVQETKSYFYDINTKITYRPNESNRLSFSIYNGKDNLDNSVSPSTSSFQGGPSFNLNMESTDLTQWGNNGASLKWSHKFNEKFYSNTILSFSNYFSLREKGTSGSFTRGGDESSSISRNVNEDNNLLDYTLKTDYEYRLSENQTITFGAEAIHNKISYKYIQNDTNTIIARNSKGQTLSAYMEDKVTFLEKKAQIITGFRYNYFTGTNKNYYEPRLSALYQINYNLKLKAAFGNYYQFAKRVIREDITEGSRDFWVLSDDENLPVSSSWQYVAGFTAQVPTYLIDVEGFYKKLSNVTEYSLRIDPAMRNSAGGGRPEENQQTLTYSENFFTGSGRAIGVDFLFQKKLGDITGWIGYTIEQVTNNIPEYGNYDFYASQDVTHEFKTVLTYNYHNWNFGANWIFATGKPYTAPEGGYQLTLLDGTTANYINVSVKNGNRLPAYHRLDISATYNFKFFDICPSSFGISIFNLYNRSNVWYMQYEIVENEIVETPVYLLGITPNISLSFKLK